MPEGPELHIAARLVNKVSDGRTYGGKIMKSAVSTKNPDVDWDEDAYSISATSRGKEIKLTLTALDPKDLKDGKKGKTSKKSGKKNGFVPKTLDILFRFGMSGKFEFQNKDAMEKHSHLNFYTREGGMVLSFVDFRRFGRWEITSKWGPKRGPCVITEYSSFRENVLSNLDKAVFKRPICETLLDQQYFNGMGNYLRAEALYRAKIPPFVSALSVLQPIKETEEAGVKTEQPDLLQLCNILATEVINLNQGEGYFYDPTKKESSFKTFLAWLQCYYQPSMQNLVDHNGRTIWFEGKAGPLAPKEKKSRERKKRSKKHDVDQEEYEKNQPEKKSKMTRNKLQKQKGVDQTNASSTNPKNKETAAINGRKRTRSRKTPTTSLKSKSKKESKQVTGSKLTRSKLVTEAAKSRKNRK